MRDSNTVQHSLNADSVKTTQRLHVSVTTHHLTNRTSAAIVLSDVLPAPHVSHANELSLCTDLGGCSSKDLEIRSWMAA